ncbi:TetR/AcrR family transcriptional regulator [Sphingomonas colocasiae]|uniref:TetR/AcrR family transcriptional regulator n=1 Tax=Sphingomonas colocasiae TaxID=1848973 RepID=A0ABS7PV70_9SPHN|nr:TetR/AcrR family transcriptional regulator [Sphingomonas colocasiae]MBY8825265.1 TetR/AcrR family transcriptional regulator [Sphingomonas colocasiae]
MSERTPRRRLRQNEPVGTRSLILEEAMRLIARDGVEEMRLKDIADAVGIRIPSIYRHFESREAIIAELARAMVEELAQFLSPDPALDPVAWMESWARGLVWFFANKPAYGRMILRDLATPGGFGPISAALGAVEDTPRLDGVSRMVDALRAAHRRGIADGAFTADLDPGFFSMMFGTVLVSLVWPYSGTSAAIGVAELERLQSRAASLALSLLR